MIPGYGHTTGIMRLFYYNGRMLSIQMDWQKCTKKFEFFLNEKIRSGESRRTPGLPFEGRWAGVAGSEGWKLKVLYMSEKMDMFRHPACHPSVAYGDSHLRVARSQL